MRCSTGGKNNSGKLMVEGVRSPGHECVGPSDNTCNIAGTCSDSIDTQRKFIISHIEAALNIRGICALQVQCTIHFKVSCGRNAI